MKLGNRWLLAVAGMVLVGGCVTARTKPATPLLLTIEFNDGTRLIGTPSIATLGVRTDYAQLDVPLAQLRKLTMKQGGELVTVQMGNGDLIKGGLIAKPFSLKTVLGELRVPVERIQTITVQVHGPMAVRLEQGLVMDCDFEGDWAESGAVVDRMEPSRKLHVRNGEVMQGPGVTGKGAVFNGGWLEADCNPAAGLEALSVSVWFKTATPSINYKLASAARWSGGNRASGWVLGTHYPEAWADDDKGGCRGDCQVDLVKHFKRGEWNHVVITYDRQRFREFINGEMIYDCQGSGEPIGRGVNLMIGNWMGSFPYRGALDEFRIYNRALSAEEVSALWSAGEQAVSR